jgi:hypothetical protein
MVCDVYREDIQMEMMLEFVFIVWSMVEKTINLIQFKYF